MPPNNNPEVVAEYIPNSSTPISLAIIEAIASVENVDPTELDFTLYDHVPPTSLDSLVSHENKSGSIKVTFPIDNYFVEVGDENRIIIFE